MIVINCESAHAQKFERAFKIFVKSKIHEMLEKISFEKVIFADRLHK